MRIDDIGKEHACIFSQPPPSFLFSKFEVLQKKLLTGEGVGGGG